MRFVLDSSITMAWVFEDEFTPFAQHVRAQLRSGEAIVPAIWRSEVANVLLMGERRKRLQEAKAVEFLQLLEELPIMNDEEESWRTMRDAWRLAREHQLTVYDATYLELALRHSVPLATADGKLVAIATKLGLPGFPALG